MNIDRRSLLKATGVAAGTALLPGVGAASVDDSLDTDTDELQEVIVVFENREAVDRLGELALDRGYHGYRALPFGYAVLTGDQIGRVASWPEVVVVHANHDVEYYNDDARELTGATVVQDDMYYTGETVHVAVIDSGIDGDHPDFANTLRHNYRFLNPLDGEDAMWTDVGPVDTASTGHGTHVSGSIAGEGTASDGQYRGMAPDAELTVYSTDAVASLLQITGAWDDLIDKQRRGEHDVQLVNNSYGATAGNNYSPFGALQLATWEAFQLGILPVFAAGNGYDPNTLGDYSIGPHVLSVAATDDALQVTDFSSKGRPPDFDGPVNYDRQSAFENLQDLYRVGDVFQSDPLVAETWSGQLGPSVNTLYAGQYGLESVYHEWTAPADLGENGVGFVDAELSWQPYGQDVDFYIHEGAEDGPVVGFGAGFVTSNPETVRAPVEPGTTYYLEIKPFENVASQYDISLDGYEALADQPSRPFGLHRPSTATPGNYVMSTLSPDDDHVYPATWFEFERQIEQTGMLYYGQFSGTSMASPVLAGLAALMYDAYRQNHPDGEWPDPLDVINTIEATSRDALESYTTWSVGTGFADGLTAVRRAENAALKRGKGKGGGKGFADFGEVKLAGTGEGNPATDAVFRPTGSRSDDGSSFTAGQTNHVTLTVSADETAVVRDRIPFDWDVVGGDHDRVYTEGGERFVEFSRVKQPSGDEPATVGYFVEAPESWGGYEFGPAQARPANGKLAGTGYVTFTDGETNYVAGVDQTSTGL